MIKKTYKCAIDFGTSNSVICALPSDGESDPILISEPTVIFFPERKSSDDLTYFVGHEAVAAYVTSGMKGRFIQSIKSILHDPNFDYTLIAGVPFTPIELVVIILRYLKQKMEAKISQPLRKVVIGRPIMFSEDPVEDQTAQRRIAVAAKHVGFDDIQFQFEPIGAAYAYEAQLTEPKTVLVVDLGGGTTDFTIMNMDPSKRGITNRQADIVSTGGVHIGGDDFDASIMWNQLAPYFGRGSQFKEWGKLFDFPSHFFTTLCTWYDIAKLKENPFKATLKSILHDSTDKPAVTRLKTLIDDDLGFGIYKAIESSKKELSHSAHAQIQFHSPNLSFAHPITQVQFETNIADYIGQIDSALTDTLARADLHSGQIDSVLLTGGSSLVRLIQDHLITRFGANKIVTDENCFNTVALGLALAT